MGVPTGHPFGTAVFAATLGTWTTFYLGTYLGGITAPARGTYIAIVPFFSDYHVDFNHLTADHRYQWLQFSGPPLQLFLGTLCYGTIFVNNYPFGTAIGWAGVPYAMHFYRASSVGLTRVPRTLTGYWWMHWRVPLPAYLVRDPLIVRYDPYVWVGTEALVAWATMEDRPDRIFDELMTARNYIDKELVHLPTGFKVTGDFWPLFHGYLGGIDGVRFSTVWTGELWLWARTIAEKPYHLFDDERYRYFHPIIKPGGKVLAAGLLKVGSIGVRATAERSRYPQPGDALRMRVSFNPAPFEVTEWFDVRAFVVGYFYERQGSNIFELNYGVTIPSAYVLECYTTDVLFQVWIATNVPSGSVLLHQAVLAYPRRVQFYPQSYSNLLTVLTDWLYNLANRDRFLLISDYSEALVVTPEDWHGPPVSAFDTCHVRTFRPFGGNVTNETDEGWEVRFRYRCLQAYVFDAIYFKYRTGALLFRGCRPRDLLPLAGGLRWMVPVPFELDPWSLTMREDLWELVDPYHWMLHNGDLLAVLYWEDPLPPYRLPDNRLIDLEKPHRFFYQDICVLTHPGSPRPPVAFIGNTIQQMGGPAAPEFYIDIEACSPFTYLVVSVGSWIAPEPVYRAESNDPYSILPHLRRTIERRFKDERDIHSNILSDVHLRIKTSVTREFVECVITRPQMFFEHRTGRDPGGWFGGIYRFVWAIPVLADPRTIPEDDWMHPSIDFWCPDNFAGFDVPSNQAIPIVLGRTECDASTPGEFLPTQLRIIVNPIVPLIAQPNTTYRFVRWFWRAESLIRSITEFLDALVPSYPSGVFPETIRKHTFEAYGPPFHAIGSNWWSPTTVPDLAYPAPAPFISGGAKIIGLGSLYRWAKEEGLTVPEWFDRYMTRNGADGDHFLSGKLDVTIVYASYWPLEPVFFYPYVWNFRGTNPYRHFSQAESVFGVFNEDWRFGTILWYPPLPDDYNWHGRHFNNWLLFPSQRARLLIPHRGWREQLPAGRMVRIPDPLETLILYGTATYHDREVHFVRQIVTLGNTGVLLLPRHARYDAIGKTVPYFTQDGGKCPLWMGEPILGVDGIPYDDGRIVVYVYSVRGVYSFVLTPAGVKDWTFEPVPKWYWKLLTGQDLSSQ
jgi:hypothetical protein